MIGWNKEVPATPCEPGVSRKVLTYSNQLMMVEVSFEKGARGNLHAHMHEQITYVACGRFAFTVNGETHEVAARDSILIAPGVQHGVVALEAGVLVDVFTPKRDDFL